MMSSLNSFPETAKPKTEPLVKNLKRTLLNGVLGVLGLEVSIINPVLVEKMANEIAFYKEENEVTQILSENKIKVGSPEARDVFKIIATKYRDSVVEGKIEKIAELLGFVVSEK